MWLLKKELTPQWTAEETKGRYETKASACHDVASHGGEVKHCHNIKYSENLRDTT